MHMFHDALVSFAERREIIMDKVIIWVNENKEWFFSGIGVTIVTLIFAAIRKVFCKKKQEKKQTRIEQVNYGTKSTQIGIQNNYYTKEKSGE